MFTSENKNSDITLCIFPHLKEFLVIDTRFGKDKLDENTVFSLSLDKLLDNKFHDNVTDEFSKLIRTDDIDFIMQWKYLYIMKNLELKWAYRVFQKLEIYMT